MPSHIEMLKFARDPNAVRGLAIRLLGLPNQEWTDWEVDFLENMAGYDGANALSVRQREKLFELRDDNEESTHYRGLSVATLIELCSQRHFELDEGDANFVIGLRGRTSIKRRQFGRFVRCCRELGEIETYM